MWGLALVCGMLTLEKGGCGLDLLLTTPSGHSENWSFWENQRANDRWTWQILLCIYSTAVNYNQHLLHHLDQKFSSFHSSGCQAVGHAEEPSSHELWQAQPLSALLLWEGNHAEGNKTGPPVCSNSRCVLRVWKSNCDLSQCESLLDMQGWKGEWKIVAEVAEEWMNEQSTKKK